MVIVGSGYAYPTKSSRSGSGGTEKKEFPRAFAMPSELWIYGAEREGIIDGVNEQIRASQFLACFASFQTLAMSPAASVTFSLRSSQRSCRTSYLALFLAAQYLSISVCETYLLFSVCR